MITTSDVMEIVFEQLLFASTTVYVPVQVGAPVQAKRRVALPKAAVPPMAPVTETSDCATAEPASNPAHSIVERRNDAVTAAQNRNREIAVVRPPGKVITPLSAPLKLMVTGATWALLTVGGR